jgi:N-acetylmuramoyl-L-alanine amidase
MGVGMERIKRRVLRQAVVDNLELIRGGPRWRRRPAPGLRSTVRLLLLAVVPAVLLAPEYLSSPAGTARRGDAGAAGPAPVALAAAGAGRAALESLSPSPSPAARLRAPRPVDAAVFPLAVERVALDPGHGGASDGSRTPGGLLEKELTLDIAGRLRRLLEASSFEVVMTREGDLDVTLEERTRRANAAGADLFVSLHVNWIENRGVRGVETYYLGPTDDPFLTQLAAAENRGSGYSLADLRTLLDEIYVGVRQDESRELAEAVQGALLASLRRVNPELEDRGVKTAPFIVLMKSEMPAILAEVSCLSNQHEAELLAKPLYRQFIAEAVAAGIRGYSEALGNPAPEGTDS